MAGLDNIKKYADGSSVEADTEDTSTEKQAPLSTKGPTSKYLPTPTGPGTGVTPELLESMQKLVAEREAQRGSFMENLKDATAWWSGGVAGPGEALSRRAKEREDQAMTTFGMKRDLAQYKVGQENAQNLQRQLFGVPGAATSTTPTTPGQPTPAGAIPTAGTTTTPSALIDLVRDPALKQAITVQGSRDLAGAEKAIQTYLAKNAEDPQLAKDVNWMLKNGLIDPKILPAAVLTKFVGSGALVPHDVRGVRGTGQGTPFGAATAIAQGANPSAVTGAPDAPALAPPPPVAKVPAPAAPAAAPAAAPTAVPTTTTTTTPALPHTQPIPKISAPNVTPSAPAATPTAAPTTTLRVASPFAPGTKEDLDFQAKNAEVPLAGGKEFAQGVEKLNATKAAQVDTAALSAGERKVRFNDIKSITEDPDMQIIFGKLAKKGLTPFVLKQLESGVNAGQFGTMGVGNLERNLMEVGATPEQIMKLHKVEKSLGAAELDYAKTYLTGQGAVSDNERKLVKDAVGSVKDPAKVLNMQASVMAERAEFDQKVATAYNKYRDTYGEYASFGKFMRSPEAISAINEHNGKLAQIIGRKPNELSDPFNSKAGQAESAADHPGKSLVNQYLKR